MQVKQEMTQTFKVVKDLIDLAASDLFEFVSVYDTRNHSRLELRTSLSRIGLYLSETECPTVSFEQTSGNLQTIYTFMRKYRVSYEMTKIIRDLFCLFKLYTILGY